MGMVFHGNPKYFAEASRPWLAQKSCLLPSSLSLDGPKLADRVPRQQTHRLAWVVFWGLKRVRCDLRLPKSREVYGTHAASELAKTRLL